MYFSRLVAEDKSWKVNEPEGVSCAEEAEGPGDRVLGVLPGRLECRADLIFGPLRHGHRRGSGEHLGSRLSSCRRGASLATVARAGHLLNSLMADFQYQGKL